MKKYKYLTYFLLCFSWQALQAQEDSHNTFCSNYTDTLVLLQNKAVKTQCDLAGYHWSSRLKPQQEKKECIALEKDETTLPSKKRQLSRILSELSNLVKLCESEEYAQRSVNFNRLDGIDRDIFTEQLIAAVKKDDVGEVKRLILQGVDPFYELGMNFGTPLYHAIAAQAEQSVKFLIDLGASPNFTCNGCPNPLNNLLENKVVDYDLLEYLLKNGSDPNYHGEATNPSPISIPVENNDIKAVKLLLANGAIWFESLGSEPLLTSAIKHDNLPLIKLLLEHGVEPDGGETCSMSPMVHAKGNAEISQLLVEHGSNCYGMTD